MRTRVSEPAAIIFYVAESPFSRPGFFIAGNSVTIRRLFTATLNCPGILVRTTNWLSPKK